MARIDTIGLWDLGPPEPVQPPPPAPPPGFEEDLEVKRAIAMVAFKHELAAYDIDYTAYLAAKRERAAFGDKPRHITMDSGDANEALTRDSRRYVRVLPR